MSDIITQNGTELQTQINAVNQKLDLVLEELVIQRQKRQALEDLMADFNIIGTDLFKATVHELDNAGIEIDGDQLKNLLFRFLRNVGTLSELMELSESMVDLAKDAGPIVTQMGMDAIQKMHELEQKGYFEFFREVSTVFDRIITHFSPEDVKLLADNVVTILETVKNLTQPEMLLAMNNAVNVYKKLDMDNIEEYSLWRAFKEIRSPEMKKGIGFIMTFLKNISDSDETKINIQ